MYTGIRPCCYNIPKYIGLKPKYIGLRPKYIGLRPCIQGLGLAVIKAYDQQPIKTSGVSGDFLNNVLLKLNNVFQQPMRIVPGGGVQQPIKT